MATKMTTEGFIAKAQTVHGAAQYDYSKVVYTKAICEVEIRCLIHGTFYQKAVSHLTGRGCKKCANKKRHRFRPHTTDSFVEKCKALHGDRYDYSKTIYGINSKTRVIIICRIHGAFEQQPSNHLSGKGCDKCARKVRRATYGPPTLTTSEFILKARLKHGEMYNYSMVNYKNARTLVDILCPVHGLFTQSPSHHLKGGCYQCARMLVGKKNKVSQDEFVERATEAHQGKYDYSETVYIHSSKKITIKCPDHGVFKQTASSHLDGRGCNKCAGLLRARGWSRTEWLAIQKGRKATLYVICVNDANEFFYKVGITYRSVSERFSTGNLASYQFHTAALFESYDAGIIYDLEKNIHRSLECFCYSPVQQFGGQTECFTDITPILPLLPKGTIFYELQHQQAA
jgi:hypothetical protein